jgi:hypothetical protein
MLAWLKRIRPPGQPTPEQAFAALSESLCMYAAIDPSCSGKAVSTGLRHQFDDSAVLVCAVHYGQLRKLSERQADTLERELRRAFARRRGVEHLLVTGAAHVDSG